MNLQNIDHKREDHSLRCGKIARIYSGVNSIQELHVKSDPCFGKQI